MRHLLVKVLLVAVLIAVGLTWNGKIQTSSHTSFITTAEARVGRPATPVSYAGVARRTPGAGAPGVGTQPANRGGPVNRVGRR